MEERLQELILQLFEIEVVKFGDFKLKSGVQSPVYFDLRIIISYPKLMELLTDLLVDMIRTKIKSKFKHVCGVPYTALPMATLVSSKSNIPMLIRRREGKDHGTKKMIEGKFDHGDECIIIEDVVTSGSSILETVADLHKEGLKVSHALVVLDREQGGVANLERSGIRVHVLTSLTKVLNTLFAQKKVNEDTVTKVEGYISSVRLLDNRGPASGRSSSRLKMTFSERAKTTRNKLTRRIFELCEAKKSTLCLAADVTTARDLLNLAPAVGPHIVVLKTHFDIVDDFTEETYLKLIQLAKKFNFFIMEDRKFSDIGNTVRLQYNRIKTWADLVTTHSIAGEDVVKALKCCIQEDEERGCFLVAELSCEGHMMSKGYAEETARMGEKHSDFVVGLVCQNANLICVPELIQLTPGVKLETGSDGLGQRYNGPEEVVMERGADLAVVGRGITAAEDPAEMAMVYREKLWTAYQKRVEE